jgi:hypothetical protein
MFTFIWTLSLLGIALLPTLLADDAPKRPNIRLGLVFDPTGDFQNVYLGI